MTEKPTINTRVAYAEFEDHYFVQQRVFAELVHQRSLSELVCIGIDGPRLDAQQTHMLNILAAVLTVGDPRIWPLKVTRLGACYGSALAGMSSAMRVMDNHFASTWHITHKLATLLIDLQQKLEQTQPIAQYSDADLLAKLEALTFDMIHHDEVVVGFGVPAREYDERTVALRKIVEDLKLHKKSYWRIFLALEKIVWKARKLPANIVIAWSAQALDLGFMPQQLGPLSIGLGVHVFLANAFEAQQQKNASMQRLPKAFIDYQGPAPRVSPRAQANRKISSAKNASDDVK